MPKVFIPHNVTRFDHGRQVRVPAFDFSKAAEFGELSVLLPDDANLLATQDCVNIIRSGLKDIVLGDYLLPVGDPSIISVCAAIMADMTGQLRILKFDKKMQKYIKLEAFL